jgi:hypothetical protein
MPPLTPGEANMRAYRIALAIATLGISLGATCVAAQTPQDKTQDKTGDDSTAWYNPKKYNPAKLFNGKSANDQLASNGHLEDRLSKQLRIQGLLAQNKELQEVCSNFKALTSCIAVLRLSHSLPIEFTCLKWNVTGVKPKGVADSCAGPAGGKAMALDRAVDLLKPDIDSRAEASKALKKAHDDIRDASS